MISCYTTHKQIKERVFKRSCRSTKKKKKKVEVQFNITRNSKIQTERSCYRSLTAETVHWC